MVNKALEIKTRILPYAAEKLSNDKFIVTSYFGGWIFLDEQEFCLLRSNTFFENEILYSKLKESGIIIEDEDYSEAIKIYSGINRNLFLQPSLHMINTTNMCNYRCRYCHAGVSQGRDLMSAKTALKIVKFIFLSSGPHLTIEFQGGECLLNWKVVKLVVEKSRKLNKIFKKDLHICIVSNLSLLDEEKLKFLTDHDVSICTSLDGSIDIHDANRKTALGENTFQMTKDRILHIKEYYKKRGLNKRVDILATITKLALNNPKEIVDAYVDLGIPILHLRPVPKFWDGLNKRPPP